MKKIQRQILVGVFTGVFSLSISLTPLYAATPPTPPPQPENTQVAPTPPPIPENEEEAPEPTAAPENTEEAPEPTAAPASNEEEEISQSTPTEEANTQEVSTNLENNDQEVDANTEVGGEEEKTVKASLEEVTSNEGGNVGDTEIVSGDANSSGTIVNTGNSNVVEEPSSTTSSEGGSVAIAHEGNGSGSTNDSNVMDSSDSEVYQDNSATVLNEMEQSSDSGYNTSSKNVGNTDIETGDANTSGTIINTLNTNIDGVAVLEFNVIDDHIGDLILDFESGCIYNCTLGDVSIENTGNGADSTNTAETVTLFSDATFQNNELNAGNFMTLSANTGYNAADSNTGGDSTITTGDANVSANVMTFANNNLAGDVVFTSVNIYGDLVGDIIFPEEFMSQGTTLANTGNGSGSANTTNYSTESNTNVLQTNIADIENNLVMDATTGNNTASKNTGGDSSIETGDANITAQVTNIVNNNILSGDWWMVIVNEAGNWIGKILGAPDDSTFAGSDGVEFEQDESGAITVRNSGNGSDSTNTASVSESSDTTIEQTNTATVRNDLNLSANTGGNSTSKNTGGNSSIETGDATIIANLINFVNNNIVGSGRLYVTMVNVFGSWVGNFVAPGQEKEVDEIADSSDQEQEEQNPVAIGGGVVASNTNSEDSSDTTNSEVEAEAEAPSLSSFIGVAAFQTPRRFYSPQAGSVLGESEEEIEVEESSDEPQESQETPEDESININLAWFLLLAPAYAGGTIVRRIAKGPKE